VEELLQFVSLAAAFYIAWKMFVVWLDDRIATVAAAGVSVSPGPGEESPDAGE